jgi:hypothetical protein
MSKENVEIALAAAATLNRGDREAFMALWDEEAEFLPLRAQLEGAAYRGHGGLERFFTEMAKEWGDSVRFEIDVAYSRGCGTARSSICACSRSRRMPSKPPGCGSSSAITDLAGAPDRRAPHRIRRSPLPENRNCHPPPAGVALAGEIPTGRAGHGGSHAPGG